MERGRFDSLSEQLQHEELERFASTINHHHHHHHHHHTHTHTHTSMHQCAIG